MKYIVSCNECSKKVSISDSNVDSGDMFLQLQKNHWLRFTKNMRVAWFCPDCYKVKRCNTVTAKNIDDILKTNRKANRVIFIGKNIVKITN